MVVWSVKTATRKERKKKTVNCIETQGEKASRKTDEKGMCGRGRWQDVDGIAWDGMIEAATRK